MGGGLAAVEAMNELVDDEGVGGRGIIEEGHRLKEKE